MSKVKMTDQKVIGFWKAGKPYGLCIGGIISILLITVLNLIRVKNT